MDRISHLMNHLKPNPTFANPDLEYVLITGCSRGIGLGLVAKFLENRKYYVIATCRSPNKQHKLRALVSKHAARATIVPLDISNETSIVQSIARVTAITNRIDVLINNAARSVYNHPYESVLDFSADELTAVLKTNVVGTANVVKHYIDLLKRPSCQAPSKVINMTSELASIQKAFSGMQDGNTNRMSTTSYRLSKAAINMLSRLQAGELGKDYNMIVTAVNPGWVTTDLGSTHGRSPTTTTEQSVNGIYDVVQKMAMDTHNGRFIDYKSNTIPF